MKYTLVRTLLGLWLVGQPPAAVAAPLTLHNTASGQMDTVPLQDGAATVHLTRLSNAVSDAVAEVDPNRVVPGMESVAFRLDILPTIQFGDEGVARVLVHVPGPLSNTAITDVFVEQVAPARYQQPLSATEYTVNIVGPLVTISLANPVRTDGTPIRVDMTADCAGPEGVVTFVAALAGSAEPDTARAGNADGDPNDANSLSVRIAPYADPLRTTVTAVPSVVLADGSAASTVTVTVRDPLGNPIPGRGVALSSSRGAQDAWTPPAGPTDASGVVVATLRSATAGITRITATDTTDQVTAAQQPEILFTRGIVLELAKEAGRREAVVGDVVTYRVAIRNLTPTAVTPAFLEDTLPPDFKYLRGTARLGANALPDPAGNRTLLFDLGTVPGFVDGNGNGRADSGEPGYLELHYDAVVGAGASPGDYPNTVVARDVCASCFISNPSSARVRVVEDPIFELATVVGKVFEDKDADGWQDAKEPGIEGAMVVLDDGTYALTDAHGRYHFPAVRPGHRLVKLNLMSLPGAARATTGASTVLWITPGLLAKASFGVQVEEDVEAIGQEGQPGVAVTAQSRAEPFEVRGDTETMTFLVNDTTVTFPGGDVTLNADGLNEVVDLQDGHLSDPLAFQFLVDQPSEVATWRLRVWGGHGDLVHEVSGEGAPPASHSWDGRAGRDHAMVGAGVYEYQVEVVNKDGSTMRSVRRLFGVNERSVISLSLRGSAFVSGSDVLSGEAVTALHEAAGILRKYPDQKVVIEGHTDDAGMEEANLDLSRRRAQAAAAHFSDKEGIPAERLIVLWFGESRPLVSNATPEGRERNRRVEIHGDVQEVERARLNNPSRLTPEVRLNGTAVEIKPEGRFAAAVDVPSGERMEVEIQNAQGRWVKTAVPVPSLTLLAPVGVSHIPLDQGMAAVGETEDARVVTVNFVGRTEPGNTVEIDGEAATVAPDGGFRRGLPLGTGAHTIGLLARNPEGVSRIVNVSLHVADRDSTGRLVTVGEVIPDLTVHLPPQGRAVAGPTLRVRGATRSGNQVHINGQPARVGPDGSFRAEVNLTSGPGELVVAVQDSAGHQGTVRRPIEVEGDRIFLLALVDGVVGQLRGQGFLEGAGMDEKTETFTEGRIAFYLKGRVAGRYLVTSAFDTGRDKFKNLFNNLDESQAGRLFHNLDPDRYYPIYGDDSKIVYDAESQGRFYLAVDSEELSFLVGNYEVNLAGDELARYQRAGYGSRFIYKSPSKQWDAARTQLTAFGAEGGQIHVRTELRATGGSLYYLRHRDVVEGSESVVFLVRDKNTGLILSRTTQVRNADYTIKYEEGRIWFQRPVASVHESETLIDDALLSGHPVSIQVEYETREPSGDSRAVGGRVQQGVGEALRVGATYVRDELGSREYTLEGADTEVHLGKGTRLVGEYARSSGADSLTFVSEDGGLTYHPVFPGDRNKGEAWKLAAELDMGSWFGAADRVEAGGYVRRAEPGFASSADLREQGSLEMGARLSVDGGKLGRLSANHAREETLLPPTTGAPHQSQLTSVNWDRQAGRLGLGVEFQDRSTEDADGQELTGTSTVAGQIRAKVTEALNARLEHQNTLSGPENDQTTLGADVAINDRFGAEVSGTTGDRGEAMEGRVRGGFAGAKLYVGERWAEGTAGRHTSTVLGAEQEVGRTTRLYTEYQWQQNGKEDRAVSLWGAEETWQPLQGLRLLLTGEHTRTEGAGGETRQTAVGGGVNYQNPSGMMVKSQAEYRVEDGVHARTQFFTSNQFELKLFFDVALLGRYRYSRTRDDMTNVEEARFEEQSLGLAYRPIHHDRVNGLVRWTRLEEDDPNRVTSTVSQRSVTDVGSAEGSFAVTPRLELVEKFAVKFKQENLGEGGGVRTRTLLNIHRVNLRVWKRLDVGTEYRVLAQREAADEKRGWLNELTWGMNDYLRLGVGYNFTDFSDDEFSDQDYSVRGWFARVQGKY